VLDGYHRFPPLRAQDAAPARHAGAPIATPLLAAVAMLRNGIKVDPPVDFLRPNSKWHRHLRAEPSGDHRLWEIAVLFHIRDAFRSGDIWLAGSRRYGDPQAASRPATGR
jgi:hypothetical protein